MSGLSIWATLGIVQTRDRTVIRRAYAARLKVTNPEDDPEGFQALRQAYEIALARAAAPKAVEAVFDWEDDEAEPGAEPNPGSRAEPMPVTPQRSPIQEGRESATSPPPADDPRAVTLGGLLADFTVFGLEGGTGVIPAAGNVFGFGVPAVTITGSAGARAGRVVLPALRELGVSRLDLLVQSRATGYRVSGVATLLEQAEIGELVSGGAWAAGRALSAEQAIAAAGHQIAA